MDGFMMHENGHRMEGNKYIYILAWDKMKVGKREPMAMAIWRRGISHFAMVMGIFKQGK
jgi:hypothetical protein